MAIRITVNIPPSFSNRFGFVFGGVSNSRFAAKDELFLLSRYSFSCPQDEKELRFQAPSISSKAIYEGNFELIEFFTILIHPIVQFIIDGNSNASVLP